MGTSLVVEPFASLTGRVPPHTPRLLINRECVGERGGKGRPSKRGFEFGQPHSNDVLCQGDCDDGVRLLVCLLGWQADFDALRGSV